jgi:HSP20 family protein
MNRNISRYNPFPTLRGDPFAQMDELFRDFAVSPFGRSMEAEPRIRMDVEEKDDAYVIKADIPGVNREDIKIDVEGNTVTITAECKRSSGDEEQANLVRCERYYGRTYRTFSLPQNVDNAGAVASYENGVLHLTLPKSSDSGRKSIAIT